MAVTRWWEFRYILLILLLPCTWAVGLNKNRCFEGADFPGYTIPHGDIIIEHGNPLDIMCVLTNSKYNGSMSFVRDGEPLPSEMIEIINSTVINLHIENPPRGSSIYYNCMVPGEEENDKKIVCQNLVSVGVKPQQVTDFSCISENWENLTCTWTAPDNNIKTDYNLTYTLGEGRSSSRQVMVCPSIHSDPNNSTIKKCFWNMSTTPAYRPVHEIYNFCLKINNTLGENQFNYTFHHFQHVLSGPPENLTVLNTTTDSVFLYWVLPLPMQTFHGLNYRIFYQRETEKTWNTAQLGYCKMDKDAYCQVINLPYAHALYDIRVSLRSDKALPNDESMWSKNSSTTFRTSSKIPDVPPDTNVGSFEIVAFSQNLQHREAYIYWKQIAPEQQNGPDFRYKISVRGNDSLKPIEVTASYAKFDHLNIFYSYIFDIWSENANGTSTNKSSVYVPQQFERIKDPMSFTKVQYSEGEFELTWDAPELSSDQYITNYTIFWCENNRDRPYQCTGKLDWKTVSNETKNFSKTVTTMSQFAISANTHNSSSGMLWASCTIIHDKNMGKLKNVWINKVDSTSMQVAWKLDCSDRIGSVEGFIVYYCPILSPVLSQCKGPQSNTTFYGTKISTGNITDLKPYTTYMLSVAVITKHTTFSQQSDNLYNTTLEAAPSGKIDLKVERVTNSSIKINWKLSEPSNGILQYFIVDIKCPHIVNSTKVEHPKVETVYNYTFKDLTSYEECEIGVVACTVKCGTQATTKVRTLTGHASRISKPTVDRRNDTSITITWNKPSLPGGKNDYYVLKLKKKYRQQNRTHEYTTKNFSYVINNCGDDGKYNTFYVSVKAVNLANDTIYDGPWSDELENYCDTPVNIIMYIVLLFGIAGMVSVGYLFTRLYYCCKVMRDVEVKLPPGLAPVVADHTLVPWSTEKHQENRASHAPPDEELLLVKMNEGRHFSGDSSGCSSGHESVTSSLESGTHISSSSDSGTEQPENYGNYCSVGVDPKLNSSSYIPVSEDSIKLSYKGCEDSSDSSPYVLIGEGEAVKSVNPGYIPFNTPAFTLIK